LLFKIYYWFSSILILLDDGFKLTFSGYDYLALRALSSRGSIIGIGLQLGVGKESDVFLGFDQENNSMALKLHRLGRISFRTIKQNRDYFEHRKSASWLYLSRLAALKEYAFMKALFDHKFPVPKPIDWNRHCVLMSLVDGFPLTQIKELKNPGKVYADLMNLLIRLAQYGLIHCDFNEFNLLINEKEEITLIDFPQMVSSSHPDAERYFNRDVQCVRSFFLKKFNYETDTWPVLKVDAEKKYSLDIAVSASGFGNAEQIELEELTDQLNKAHDEEDQFNEEKNEDSSDEELESDEIAITQQIRNEESQKSCDNEINDITQKLLITEMSSKSQDVVIIQENFEKDDSNTLKEEKLSGSEEETQEEYIRRRVKKVVMKKNKQKVKHNNSKVKIKQETRDIVKNW